MIAAAEADRKVMITLQLAAAQGNKAIAKQFEGQVLAAEEGITRAAETQAKKRNDIHRKEANTSADILKKSHEKQAGMLDKFERERERERQLREKRAGKLMVRDAKAKEKALQEEAAMTKRYHEKMATDIKAAHETRTEANRRATEAGVAALQGAMDLAEGLAILGITSDESFEKFAKTFVQIQAGFKSMKGLTELFWKGREALVALSSATKAQASANALLAASNRSTAASQTTSIGAVGGLAAGGPGGAAIAGLTVAATAAAAALYYLTSTASEATDREKENKERLEKERRDAFENRKRAGIRRIELGRQYEESRAREYEYRRKTRESQELSNRARFTLGGPRDQFEQAEYERQALLREQQALEQERAKVKFGSPQSQLRVNQDLEANAQKQVELERQRLQILRDQQKALQEQLRTSKDAIKTAQDSQKSELQRYAGLSRGQQSLVNDIARRYKAGEQLTERDIRILESTGQGAEIVRDYRANQGAAAGGDAALSVLSGSYRDSKKAEEEAKKQRQETEIKAAKAAEEERKIRQTLPNQIERQERLRKETEQSQRSAINQEIDREARLRKLNSQQYKPEAEQRPEGANPFVRPQAGPARAAGQAADEVAQSGIQVEQALQVLKSAMVNSNERIASEIESIRLLDKSYS